MTSLRNPSDSTATPRGELELIRRIRTELAPGEAASSGGVGFGDDMAAAEPGQSSLLWTTDMLMDGVDFDSRRHDWYAIGRKAMSVNLSDCAAMAVVPESALVALALNDSMSMDDAVALVQGVRDCGRDFGCQITGGDTNSWTSPTALAVVVAGRAESGQRPVTRDGARPRDGIYLTGLVGGSLLGRHLTFTPRVREALEISRRLTPHAMIDISDGLALDLWRICDASRVGAVLDELLLERVIHPDARARATQDGASAQDHALGDGEDFELIVALPPDASADEIAHLGLARIGEFTASCELRMRRAGGSMHPLEPRGWQHFQ